MSSEEDERLKAELRILRAPTLDAFRASLPGLPTSHLLNMRLDPMGARELCNLILGEIRVRMLQMTPPSSGEAKILGAATLALDDELDLRLPPRKIR
jgi:hypothetical protein